MSNYLKEDLPDFQKRHLKSDFDHYKERYKDIFMMKREDGILELKMHTDGGPFTHSWMWHEMFPAAWMDIGNDPENQVIILTGTGDKWMVANPEVWVLPMREWPPDAAHKAKMETTRILQNLLFCVDVPVIGCVNGPGGHTEIALACDITLCTEDANFWDPHFPGGSSPGDGLGFALQQTMGHRQAAYYCYTGKDIKGKLALELGLVSEALPREELLPRAWELARFIMERPRAMRYVTHAQLMRPWRRAFVEDADMQSFSMTYAFLLNDKRVYEWIMETKKRGRL